MRIIFDAVGGIGKNIAATVIVKLLKNKYPDSHLTVLSSYPEIFENNPNVNELDHINHRSGHFWRGLDYDKILVQDPYHHTDLITKKSHLIEVWAKIYDLDYNGEKPEMFFTDEEEQSFQFQGNKPIMVLHPNGGTETELYNYNWSRDLPEYIVNEVINKYKDEYDIYHIKSSTQRITYSNTIVADYDIRTIAMLIMQSDKRLFIDSFAQHLATCLDKPSTVCWITTSPSEFGYEIHNNIIRAPYEIYQEFTCYEGYNLIEPLALMPWTSNKKIFNLDQILNTI